jgi:hypothetical protein
MELKLAKLPDRTPVKITVSVSPELNKALQNYATAYKTTYGEEESVADLIPFILEDYLKSDRTFAKVLKGKVDQPNGATATRRGEARAAT